MDPLIGLWLLDPDKALTEFEAMLHFVDLPEQVLFSAFSSHPLLKTIAVNSFLKQYDMMRNYGKNISSSCILLLLWAKNRLI